MSNSMILRMLLVLSIVFPGCMRKKLIQPQQQELSQGHTEISNQVVKEKDWIDNLSFPPGTSLREGQTQKIRMLSISELKKTDQKLWVAGKGYAQVNGGSSSYFWNSTTPPQLEIEIVDVTQIASCKALIQKGIPKGKKLSIIGKGQFKNVEVQGNYVGIFRLDKMSVCGLVVE